MKNNLKFLRRKSIGMALIGVLTFLQLVTKGLMPMKFLSRM